MTQERVVVGIDAGGTKTRAFAITRAGAIVGRGAGGGANLLSSADPAGSIGAALREARGELVAVAGVLSCVGRDRAADRARGVRIVCVLAAPDARGGLTPDAQAALCAGDP